MRERLRRIPVTCCLVATSLAFLVPLAWMLLCSVGDERSLMNPDTIPWPASAGDAMRQGAQNYRRVLTDDVVQFPLYLRNTLWIAALGVAGTVLSSAIVAYGFARVRWRGRQAAFALMLLTMMIPFPAIMVPLHVLFRDLGFIGSFKPLWVPSWFGHAFSIFLLRQFYLGIPRELDDAARLDGCTHVGIFRHVILPLSRPGLAVVALLQFMFIWNDFLAPKIFLVNRDQFTLALGLELYQSQQGSTPWHLLMAAGTLFIAPVVVLFLVTSGTFLRGARAGVGGGSDDAAKRRSE
jgi:multiple sugar transport system permease protein